MTYKITYLVEVLRACGDHDTVRVGAWSEADAKDVAERNVPGSRAIAVTKPAYNY